MNALTKKQCENALTHITARDRHLRKSQEVIKELIHIHFDPIPLPYDKLKVNRWVWYSPLKCCCQIFSKKTDDKMKLIALVVHDMMGNKSMSIVEYKENHFFPLKEYR